MKEFLCQNEKLFENLFLMSIEKLDEKRKNIAFYLNYSTLKKSQNE